MNGEWGLIRYKSIGDVLDLCFPNFRFFFDAHIAHIYILYNSIVCYARIQYMFTGKT